MGREGAAPQVEVEMKREFMDVVNSYKYLGSCFSKGWSSSGGRENKSGSLTKNLWFNEYDI